MVYTLALPMLNCKYGHKLSSTVRLQCEGPLKAFFSSGGRLLRVLEVTKNLVMMVLALYVKERSNRGRISN